MEIVDGKIILGTRPCYCANHPAGIGKTWDITWCKNYTKARGNHNCEKKTCISNRSKRSGIHEISKRVVTCGTCKGTGIVKEDYCDTVRLPDNFPVVIIRQNRSNTWNESYLGMGCLYSVEDYGRAQQSTDEEILVKLERKTQAINIVKSKVDLTVCDGLAVYVTRNGYSVRAYWAQEGEKVFSGINGLSVGLAVYNAGANGTLCRRVGRVIKKFDFSLRLRYN